MTLYDYHCKKCGYTGEYYVANAKKHPPQCERCETPGNLERVAVQAFMPTSSEHDSRYDMYRLAVASGGKKVATLLTINSTSQGASIRQQAVVQMPKAGAN
jgi:putative FmdB family regulatory protein